MPLMFLWRLRSATYCLATLRLQGGRWASQKMPLEARTLESSSLCRYLPLLPSGPCKLLLLSLIGIILVIIIDTCQRPMSLHKPQARNP